jgi:PAS domain-containing protein
MNLLTEKTKRWFRHFGPALTVAIIGSVLSVTLWHLVVALETRLLVEVTPGSDGYVIDGHWLSWIVLIFGWLLSGLMALVVQASDRHARDLEITNLQFDAALNNMVQGLLMYDPAGHLIISNRRFAEIYGMPWEKWSPACLGTTVREGIKLADRLTNVTTKNPTQLVGEIQGILSRRKPGTFIIERSDGRTYASKNSPMADGGYVVTLDDITEARRNEEKDFSFSPLRRPYRFAESRAFLRKDERTFVSAAAGWRCRRHESGPRRFQKRQ